MSNRVLLVALLAAACGCATDVGPNTTRGGLLGSGGSSVLPPTQSGSAGAFGAAGMSSVLPPGAQGGAGKAGTSGMQMTNAVTGAAGRIGGVTMMMSSAGRGGTGASGTGPTGSAGSPITPGHTNMDPVIPAVKGDCPAFKTGSLDYMGLTGLQMQVGAMQEGSGPLVFYWHGTGSTAGESAQFAGTKEVLAAGGIVVAPNASSGMGSDCSGTGTFSMGDFDIADQIAACAVRDYHIDPHRIYTTGCSAGGLQAGCMATVRSNYIAAVLPNSGGVVFQQALEGMHVPAVMTMHGGASDMVIVTFSQTSATLDMQFKSAGGFVINCDHGGGHCQAPADLQAAGWVFLKDHPYGVSPEPYGMTLPANFPSYCKIL